MTDITKRDSGNIKNLSKQVKQMLETQLKMFELTEEMNHKLESNNEKLEKMDDRLTNVEESEEIKNWQLKIIKTSVYKRVNTFVNKDDLLYGMAMSDIYRFLRNNFRCGDPVATTEKRDYENVLEGIKQWEPDMEYLKHKKLERERKQREQRKRWEEG